MFGRNIVYSGGGYFRVLPYNIIKQLSKKSSYIMSYFHPRDFDFNQPMVPGLSVKRKFKSYIGLKKCRKKLEKFLTDFKFEDLACTDNKINWDQAKIFKI